MSRGVRRARHLAWAFACGALAIAVACSDFSSNDPPLGPESDSSAGPDVTASDSGGGTDAADGAPVVPRCNTAADFQTPVAVAGLRSVYGEKKARLTPNERTIYFTSNHQNGDGENIWVATRPDENAAFGAATAVGVVNTTSDESDLTLSADGTLAVFGSNREGGVGQHDLWSSLHNGSGFGVASPIVTVNAPEDEGNPFLAIDGLWFTSSRTGPYTLWHAPRASGTFGPPVEVAELRSGVGDFAPVLSANGLTLYFGSRRPGGAFGSNDIWSAKRATLQANFGNIVNVTPLNSNVVDNASWLSADDCRIYLESDRDEDAGVTHVYMAERPAK
jgi:WD40 repeat protein